MRERRGLPSRAKHDAGDVAYSEVKDLRPLRDKRLESFEPDEIERRVAAAMERGNHKRVYTKMRKRKH